MKIDIARHWNFVMMITKKVVNGYGNPAVEL